MLKRLKKRLSKVLIKTPGKLFVKIFVGIFICYLLFSYFAVNPIAKKLVPYVAEKSFASKASVAKVAFDPFRLKATIENFKLTKKNNEPLVSLKKLVVDFEAIGMFDLAWKFKKIGVFTPQVNVGISPNGELNWAELIAKLNEDKAPPSDTIPRLVIDHILIKQGAVEYNDENRPEPLSTTLTPLNFELKGFSTLPKDRGDYLVSAKFSEDGGTLKWKGDMGVNPVASKGVVALEGIKLAKMVDLIKGLTLPFAPSSGDIQINFDYDFSLPKTVPTLALNSLAFSLSDVRGVLAEGGDVALTHASLGIPRVDFTNGQKTELYAKALDFKLAGFSLNQGKDTRIALKESVATLPQFSLQIQDKLQVEFQNLNFNLTDFNINKDGQALLVLPSMDVNEVSLDLAANSANINQIVLPAGKLSALRDSTGKVNWQRAFVSNKQPKTEAIATSAAKQISKAETEVIVVDGAPVEQPMTFEIASVQLKNWVIAVKDESFKHPLSVDIADFNLDFALAAPQGNIEINQLQSDISGISAKNTQTTLPLASINKAVLSQGLVSVAEQKISAQAFTVSGLKTSVIKGADTLLNWVDILAPAQQADVNASKSNKQSNADEWAVQLKKIVLDKSSIHIEDKSIASPVILDIHQASIEVKNATLDLKQSLPIKASFRVKQGGQFSTKGKLRPLPLQVNLGFKLSDFSLKPFASYVNKVAFLKLNSGAADVSGKLDLKQKEKLALIFDGQFDIKNLALLEEADGAPFLSWGHLKSDSLNLSLSPDKIHMAALNIVNPAGKFIINEDKSMNVTRILRSETIAANEAAIAKGSPQEIEQAVTAPSNNTLGQIQSVSTAKDVEEEAVAQQQAVEVAPAKDAFPVSIETIRIDNGMLEFADLSLTPQFGTNIHSLTGVINGLATKAAAVSQVELDGKVDEYGAARIRGSLQPFSATDFTDLKLKFTNLEMANLTPYSGKFAGRRIDSGKLSVDLEYKIKQRQLAGKNKFVINKLKLGEKIDSKDAADLPLDLAIAILEDSDGLIDLDLPIAGSLDDPKFSYGSIFWKAFKNVLTKIITAPFRALGSIFGGGAEDFDGIGFETGVAILAPPELEQLAKVSEALSKRQGLSLGIVPSYDAAKDKRALQEAHYRLRVAEEMGIEIADGQLPGPVDLANEKTQKAIISLHDDLTKKSIFKKLASKFEEPEEGYYEKAQESLIKSVEIVDEDLQVLANSRGEAILKTLIDAKVDANRISMEKPVKATAKDKVVKTKLTLDTKKAALSAIDVEVTEPAVVEPTEIKPSTADVLPSK